LLSCLGRNKKPDPPDYHRYIQWLEHAGKLDNYLDRSISYVFMRDLGKSQNSPDTRENAPIPGAVIAMQPFGDFLGFSIPTLSGITAWNIEVFGVHLSRREHL
jgi:hypothetical protein